MSRFDYVAYDSEASAKQSECKQMVMALEEKINSIGTPNYMPGARSKAIAITALEEVYMWIGKAIRDDQIARNGSAPLQEERKNG